MCTQQVASSLFSEKTLKTEFRQTPNEMRSCILQPNVSKQHCAMMLPTTTIKPNTAITTIFIITTTIIPNPPIPSFPPPTILPSTRHHPCSVLLFPTPSATAPLWNAISSILTCILTPSPASPSTPTVV